MKYYSRINYKKNLRDVNVFHDMDRRLKLLCKDDINLTLKLMGRSERIGEFLEKELPDLRDHKIPDRVAFSKDGKKIFEIEFVSDKNISHQVFKQNQYGMTIFENEKIPVMPLMFTLNYREPGRHDIQWGDEADIIATTNVCPFYLIDGDKLLNEIQELIKNNPNESIKVKRRHMIFLSYAMYTNYSLDPFDMLCELCNIINRIGLPEKIDDDLRICYVADCRRFIKNKEQQEKIFGMIEMKAFLFDEVVEQMKIDNEKQMNKVIEEIREDMIEENKKEFEKKMKKELDEQVKKEIVKREKELDEQVKKEIVKREKELDEQVKKEIVKREKEMEKEMEIKEKEIEKQMEKEMEIKEKEIEKQMEKEMEIKEKEMEKQMDEERKQMSKRIEKLENQIKEMEKQIKGQ